MMNSFHQLNLISLIIKDHSRLISHRVNSFLQVFDFVLHHFDLRLFHVDLELQFFFFRLVFVVVGAGGGLFVVVRAPLVVVFSDLQVQGTDFLDQGHVLFHDADVFVFVDFALCILDVIGDFFCIMLKDINVSEGYV